MVDKSADIKFESLPIDLGTDVESEIPVKLQAWLTYLDERMNEQQAQLKMLLESAAATEVVEVAVTKLEPTRDDIIIFWMPSSLTHVQIQQIGASFDKVIAGRFRYILLVRDAVELELITKSPGLLKLQ